MCLDSPHWGYASKIRALHRKGSLALAWSCGLGWLFLVVASAAIPRGGQLGAADADEPVPRTRVVPDLVLELDPAWPKVPLLVSMRGAEELLQDFVASVPAVADPAAPERFTLQCPRILVGRYEIEVLPMNWRTPVQVVEAGGASVLRIRPPVRVTVRLCDEAGRVVAAAAVVKWLWEPPGGGAAPVAAGDTAAIAGSGVGAGSYTFLAAVGRVRVLTEVAGYVDAASAWASAGEKQPLSVTVRLRRAGSVTVHVRLPLPDASFQTSVWLEGGSAADGRDGVRDVTSFARVAPGKYLIRLRDVPAGYELPQPISVVVTAGAEEHITVSLVRAR